ncbi:hypothetical protein ABZP36_033261 [Zizania latifolia]
MDAERERPAAVVLVPFPAQGHVNPMINLARALAARGVAVTVALADFIHRRFVGAGNASGGGGGGVVLASIPTGIPDDGGPGGDNPGFASIQQAMEHHMPAHLERVLLRDMAGCRVACIVADVLASWAVDVAARCGVTAVGFWPAMVASYLVVAATPELLDKGLVSEAGVPLWTNGVYNDKSQVKEDLNRLLPAELELSTEELPWFSSDPATQKSRFSFWLRTMERVKRLPCVLVNSFPGESTPAVVVSGSDLQHHQSKKPLVLPVGPLLSGLDQVEGNNLQGGSPAAKNISMWQADRSCMDWLDQQRPRSVTYVSFGSWVAPPAREEITELALGLEATGRPFLWVLKDDQTWRAGLPCRYAEAVAGRGMIIAWAPQEDVLEHEAVVCYLTHCGWNSALEAVRHGVRLLCYPVSGDHFINCAYIIKVSKVGIRLRTTNRSDVEDCIRRIMEGEDGRRLQEKVNEMRDMVMTGDGETRCIATRNIRAFIDGIIGHI